MNARASVALAFLCAFHVAAPSTAVGQVHPDEFTIGGAVGGQIANALQSARAAARAKGLQASEIAAARQRYWAAYPDGPDLAAAEADFERTLAAKDFYYLMIGLANLSSQGRGGPAPMGGLGGVIQGMTGGELDRGIRTAAREVFDAWVAAVGGAQAARGVMPILNDEMLGSEASVSAYARYKTLRDLAELLFGPKSPMLSPDQRDYLSGVITHELRLTSLAEGRRQYDAMAAALGDEILRNFVEHLRPQLYIRVPDVPYRYLDALAADRANTRKDDRLYVLLLFYNDTRPLDWAKRVELVDDLVARYGQARVTEFARRARTDSLTVSCPGTGAPSCLHQIFARGETAHLDAELRRRRDDAARLAAAVAVDPTRAFEQPTAETSRTRAYWEWVVDQNYSGETPRGRELRIFEIGWNNVITPLVPQSVRIALEYLTPGLHIHHRNLLLGAGYRTNDRSEREAYIQKHLGELRTLCQAEGDQASTTCELYRMAEEAVQKFSMPR